MIQNLALKFARNQQYPEILRWGSKPRLGQRRIIELDAFGRGTPHSQSLSPKLHVQNLTSDDLQVRGLRMVPAWLPVAWNSNHLGINTYPVHLLTSPASTPALLSILLHHIQALILRVFFFFSWFEILYYIYLCGGRVGSQVPGLERKCQKASVGVGSPPFMTPWDWALVIRLRKQSAEQSWWCGPSAFFSLPLPVRQGLM